VRFEVFAAVRRMVIFFSVSAPCRLVGRYQSFEKKNILSPSSGLQAYQR
jgi:hypothetical protein